MMRRTEEEFMNELKKNHPMSDEEMSQVSGGVLGDTPLPKFKPGDHFRVDDVILEGYVISIKGYYGGYAGWVYNCRLRDKEGWYENPEYEFNMEPF